MKALHIALFVLVGLITVASAAGGATAQKQRVAIDVRIIPNGKFALTPLQAGALKSDSGASTGDSRRPRTASSCATGRKSASIPARGHSPGSEGRS